MLLKSYSHQPVLLRLPPCHKFTGSFGSIEPKAKKFKACSVKNVEYSPCEERDRAMTFPTENMIYRERGTSRQKKRSYTILSQPLRGCSCSPGWSVRAMSLNLPEAGPCFLKASMLILMTLLLLFQLLMVLSDLRWITGCGVCNFLGISVFSLLREIVIP